MIAAIIGVAGTLFGAVVGTVLGYILSERAAKNREERNEVKQVRSIRTIIGIEIEQNRKLLKDFREKIVSELTGEDYTGGVERSLSRRFIESPMPAWGHKMWESQAALIATALNENEIRDVQGIHARLDAIEAIRNALQSMDLKDRQVILSRQGPGAQEQLRGARSVETHYSYSDEFSTKSPALWREFERIVGEIMDAGNPL